MLGVLIGIPSPLLAVTAEIIKHLLRVDASQLLSNSSAAGAHTADVTQGGTAMIFDQDVDEGKPNLVFVFVSQQFTV